MALRQTQALGMPLMVLIALSACQSTAPTPDFATLLETVEPAVFNVRSAGRTRGSGFLVHASGLVLTAWHVVDGAEDLAVSRPVSGSQSARLVARDEQADLALLAIEAPPGLSPLVLAADNSARLGEWLVVLGDPFGQGMTVSVGVVGSSGRALSAGGIEGWIQTDAAINPGNSGGPALNAQGSVVGVATARIAAGHGVGFVSPVSAARRLLQQQLAESPAAR